MTRVTARAYCFEMRVPLSHLANHSLFLFSFKTINSPSYFLKCIDVHFEGSQAVVWVCKYSLECGSIVLKNYRLVAYFKKCTFEGNVTTITARTLW